VANIPESPVKPEPPRKPQPIESSEQFNHKVKSEREADPLGDARVRQARNFVRQRANEVQEKLENSPQNGPKFENDDLFQTKDGPFRVVSQSERQTPHPPKPPTNQIVLNENQAADLIAQVQSLSSHVIVLEHVILNLQNSNARLTHMMSNMERRLMAQSFPVRQPTDSLAYPASNSDYYAYGGNSQAPPRPPAFPPGGYYGDRSGDMGG